MSWNLQEFKADSIGHEMSNKSVSTSANPSFPGTRLSFFLLLSPLAHLTFSQIPASDTVSKYLMMKDSILPLHRTRETVFPIALVPSRSDGGGGGGAEEHDLNFRDASLLLFFHDIKLVLTILPWFPKLLSPLRTVNPFGELYLSSRNIREILLNVFWGLCGGFDGARFSSALDCCAGHPVRVVCRHAQRLDAFAVPAA